jgi:hypothetical protein
LRVARATRQPPRQGIRVNLAVFLEPRFCLNALTNENGPPGERSPSGVVQLELHGSPPVSRSRVEVSREDRLSTPGFSLAERRELVPPVVSPACLGRFPHPALRQLTGDERLTVPGQITEAGIPQSIGGDPCR